MVLRGGKKYPLPVGHLVVGDIVDVKFGDRVPADLRVIRSAGLKVNSLIHSCTGFLCPDDDIRSKLCNIYMEVLLID